MGAKTVSADHAFTNYYLIHNQEILEMNFVSEANNCGAILTPHNGRFHSVKIYQEGELRYNAHLDFVLGRFTNSFFKLSFNITLGFFDSPRYDIEMINSENREFILSRIGYFGKVISECKGMVEVESAQFPFN